MSLSSNTFTVSGFVLTRRRVEDKGSVYIEYWLSSDSGPVKLTTNKQKMLFFIRHVDFDDVDKILCDVKIDYEYKNLHLKNFQHEPVTVLYFKNSHLFYKSRDLLTHYSIVCYEDDIRIDDRFLMERFIYGSMDAIGDRKDVQTKSPPPSYLHLRHVQCKTSAYYPNLKMLSLDIECSDKGELYSIGLAAKDYQRVLMIGASQANAPDWIRWCESEVVLLRCLLREIEIYDPDIFVGWNVINFDFRLLIERAKLHNIILTIGRDRSPVRWRDANGETNKGFLFVSGRIVIDGIDALKTATYQFSSFSLEFVSRELLGKGKLSDDPDDRMAEINHDFHENKIKLARYNLQDCLLVLEIFNKTKLLDFLVLRSQLTGLELDRIGGSVAAFSNLYLPKLHRAGYVSPNRPEHGGLASPGGYVLDSFPGIYKHVLVLDFKSLYPSIIRTFKIDPLGLIEGLKDPESSIKGYKGAFFSRDKHFLPDIITSLWKKRDDAKRNNDFPRSQAIKILMNSFYGILGSGGCPFYDTRLASSITLRGHSIMQKTTRWIEEKGYKVIYGDTDSIFVWVDTKEKDEDKVAQIALSIGEALQDSINIRWKNEIKNQFSLESHLEIELETYFSKFLMPTIRGSSLGSKKRYAGIKETRDSQELIFKGLEAVRSDWTPLAKRFQYTLYQMVFADEDVCKYIIEFITDTRKGCFDDLLVYRKRLRRRLDDYVKNIPPHVKAARRADDLNRTMGKPSRYENKGWISYVMTLNGPQVIEHLKFERCKTMIDYEHYIEKQLQPIAEAILPFVGQSFENITQAQFGLFE